MQASLSAFAWSCLSRNKARTPTHIDVTVHAVSLPDVSCIVVDTLWMRASACLALRLASSTINTSLSPPQTSAQYPRWIDSAPFGNGEPRPTRSTRCTIHLATLPLPAGEVATIDQPCISFFLYIQYLLARGEMGSFATAEPQQDDSECCLLT